jgi:putative oxidoreductase
LLLRLGLGIVFLGHGLQKFGLFEAANWPSNLSEQAEFVSLFGYSSTDLMAWVITAAELTAGTLVVLGIAVPLGAAAAIGTMLQFVAGPQWPGGLFGNDTNPGFEQGFVLLLAAAGCAFIGPGKYSLEGVLRWRIMSGWRWALAGIALGVVVGLAVLIGYGPGVAGNG